MISMKLLNDELDNKIWEDVHDKVLEYLLHNSLVRDKIGKNFGRWGNDDSLIRLKIFNPKIIIENDLDETT